MSQSRRAAIAKSHTLGGSNHKHSPLTVPEAGSQTESPADSAPGEKWRAALVLSFSGPSTSWSCPIFGSAHGQFLLLGTHLVSSDPPFRSQFKRPAFSRGPRLALLLSPLEHTPWGGPSRWLRNAQIPARPALRAQACACPVRCGTSTSQHGAQNPVFPPKQEGQSDSAVRGYGKFSPNGFSFLATPPSPCPAPTPFTMKTREAEDAPAMEGETHQNQKQILTEHETFCGDHYLDCGDGLPDVDISQNLSNGTLTYVQLIVVNYLSIRLLKNKAWFLS